MRTVHVIPFRSDGSLVILGIVTMLAILLVATPVAANPETFDEDVPSVGEMALPADEGAEPADAGVMPVDAGAVPSDAFSRPSDEGVPLPDGASGSLSAVGL